VFGAEERYNWNLDLQMVPVGVSYGDHRKSRTPVRVAFGEAVPAQQYRQVYQEDERNAAHQLKMDIASRMKSLTLHIPNKKHYSLYRLLLDELESNRKELLEPALVNSRVSSIQNKLNGELVEESEFLLEQAEEYDLDIQEVVHAPSIGGKDVLLSPFYAFSVVNNALPYQVVRWFVNSYLEDEAFEASVKFLVGLLLPVYYLIIGFILFLSGLSGPWTIGYVLASLATAPCFVRAKDLLVDTFFNKQKRISLLNNKEFAEKLEKFKNLRCTLFKQQDN
jgi:hypothetical protein